MTDVAEIDRPETIFSELTEEIRSEELNRPRSTQRTIGPSGLGVECTRWLLHMLAKDDEPEQWVNWWAWVGTAMHGRLEGIFRASPLQAFEPSRWLIESEVTVGKIGDDLIVGHVDLYDTGSQTVIDWKGVGDSSTKKFQANIRKHGHPGDKYRVQLQAYGLGMLIAGHPVRQVMNVYLPRNARSMRDIWFWSEPFNPQVALDALRRANGLHDLISTVGLAAALEMFQDAPCGESHCPWCPKARQSAAPSTSADPFGSGLTPKGNA